jgi:hypothetical protein
MGTIYSSVQRFQLDLFQTFIIGLFLFAIGIWVGLARSRKLGRKMVKMEREIRDLNAELLYNTGDTVVRKMHR